MAEPCEVIKNGKFPSSTCHGCGYYDDSVNGEEVCTKGLKDEEEDTCN